VKEALVDKQDFAGSMSTPGNAVVLDGFIVAACSMARTSFWRRLV